VGLNRFYQAFFSDDSQVRFLWPGKAVDDPDPKTFVRLRINPNTLTRDREETSTDAIEVVQSDNARTVSGRTELHRDCPFCGARANLSLVGFRASTLTSIFIDQLFTSAFNDDKKLLAFSDSVQDAAHRSGFFGARTWSFNLRVAIQKTVAGAEGRTLAELPELFAKTWRRSSGTGLLGDVEFVSTFLAPNMQWFAEYDAMRESGEIPKGSGLILDVERRVAYEIANEYGLQARIGRSLPRTGCSTVAIDAAMLDAATDDLLERLRNEIGGLRELQRPALQQFLLGTRSRPCVRRLRTAA
jgi:DEAD/DEAH box helicase domain-containing protein